MTPVTVTLENGPSEQITLQPLRVSDYETGFRALEAGDQFTLLDLAARKQAGWSKLLAAESFNTAVDAMSPEMKLFFAAFGRRAFFLKFKDEVTRMTGEPQPEAVA